MKKIIVNPKPTPSKQTNAISTGYSRRLAITYGNVDSNNDDGTCNVTLVTGFPATNIKIPSKIYPSKDPTIGGIDYPVIGAYVKILHPEGDLNSGWIEPAELDYKDDAVVSDLPAGKEISPGGWESTYDQETGEKTFTNGVFELIVNPDTNSFSLTDFEGNTFNSNGAVWEINGNADFAVRFDALNTAITSLISSINSSVTGLIPAHTHISSVPGLPSGPGVGVAPTVTGDITPAKVDNIKFS